MSQLPDLTSGLFIDRCGECGLAEQLSVADLLRAPLAYNDGHDLTLAEDYRFWEQVVGDKLRARSIVHLRNFGLMEWFPRSPGLFWADNGYMNREKAREKIYQLSDSERSYYLQSNPVEPIVYTLGGKSGMVNGGLGCYRFRDKLTDRGRLWFMTASSELIAHAGIPIAITDDVYERVIDDIIEHGALMCNITGRLTFVPDFLVELYDEGGMPKVYLLAEQVSPIGGRDRTLTERPIASAAVICGELGDPDWSGGASGSLATYVQFVPGRRGTLTKRAEWLHHYVAKMHGAVVLTDFDEQRSHFGSVPFSLTKAFTGAVDESDIKSAFLPWTFKKVLNYQRQVNVYIKEMRVGDTFSNINNSTIVNRSHLQNALNTLGEREDVAVALREVAAEVERSGNPDAVENFNGFTEELERETPRPSRLKSFWNGLVDALPAITNLGETTSKLISLFSGQPS